VIAALTTESTKKICFKQAGYRLKQNGIENNAQHKLDQRENERNIRAEAALGSRKIFDKAGATPRRGSIENGKHVFERALNGRSVELLGPPRLYFAQHARAFSSANESGRIYS